MPQTSSSPCFQDLWVRHSLRDTTFTDTWTQTNVVVADLLVTSTTCGGTITTTVGSQTVAFTGGTGTVQVGGVPGICEIRFEVVMNAAGSISFDNTLPAGVITTNEGFVNPIDVTGDPDKHNSRCQSQ